jgi:hypothetical protein
MLELTETPPSNVFLPKEILKEIKKEGKVWYAHCDKYNFTSKYEIEKMAYQFQVILLAPLFATKKQNTLPTATQNMLLLE